jgi:NAD(P)-dependent dehydrogenase (short-subunit alcohol dehydrogenase family)
MVNLEGKVAVVTGAAQGIGRAIAERFVREGARVVIADMAEAAAQRVADELNAAAAAGGGSEARVAIAVETDVASQASVEAMVAETVAAFGGLDALVCNAALWKQLERRAFMAIPVEEWDRVFAVNTRGAFLCCAAAVPAMEARGGGRIILIGSATIGTAQATLTHYVASKAALIGLMRCAARELGPKNICVNMVHPGLTDSGGVDRAYLEERAQNKFIKRVGMPEDLTGLVTFLASDDSGFITAQQLFADGGGVLN